MGAVAVCDPGQSHQQSAGGKECDENPVAALRALKMIEQERYRQQLGYRGETEKPDRQRTVSPQHPDEGKGKKRHGQQTSRLPEKAKKCEVQCRKQYDEPEHHENGDAGR